MCCKLKIKLIFSQVGDIINVTKLDITGQFEGELNNKVGYYFDFKFCKFNFLFLK